MQQGLFLQNGIGIVLIDCTCDDKWGDSECILYVEEVHLTDLDLHPQGICAVVHRLLMSIM